MHRIYQIDEEGRRYCRPAFGLVEQPPFWSDQPVGVSLTMSIDMTDADSFRKEISKNKTHVTINSLIIKATADVLEDFPIMSGMWLSKDKIRVPNPGEICILYTIQIGDSIEVRWIEKASQKNLLELSNELNAEIKEAKSRNKHSMEERKPPEPLFYFANVGTIGAVESGSSNWFPPTITAELAVGAMLEKPAAKDNKIQIRKMMNAIALFDHRAMQANIPAEFLTQLKRNLEEPATYLI